MRITNGMMVNNMLRDITRNQERMDALNRNLSSGKKFLKPSDDPLGVSKSLKLNTDINTMAQFKRNVEDSQSWLGTTETATDNMIDVLQKVRELTVQGANGTNSSTERAAITSEIDQLKNQLINIGNTSYAGSYIFSGYKTDQPLLKDDGTYDLGGTVGLPVTLDNKEIMDVNLGIGDKFGLNFVGQRIFGLMNIPADIDSPIVKGPVDSGKETQLIKMLDQLTADLGSGNDAGITGALKRLDSHLDNINAVRSEIGVKMNRLELTSNRIDDDTLNLTELLSKNEDADMTEVIMNLKMEENVYKSSLSGGARIIQLSLLDFLR